MQQPMNAVSCRILKPAATPEWAEWDHFVRQAPSGTVYHTSEWLFALAEGMRQDIRAHTASVSGAIRAGVVVRAGTRFGLVVGRKPWATAYNGIVCAEDEDPGCVRNLLRDLVVRYSYVRLVHPPAAGAVDRHAVGWETKLGKTPVVDISDLDKLWHSFDRRVRQRVRKATSLGVTVADTDSSGTFFDLYRMTYVRQGIAMPLPKKDVETTLDLARQQGAIKVFVARNESGEPAAGLVVGADAKRAYFMLAGSDPEHRKSDAMTLLWWRVMQKYAETHTEIDLVGMGIPSIDRFKLTFSPSIAPVLDTWRYASTCAKAMLVAGEGARKVIQQIRNRCRARV